MEVECFVECDQCGFCCANPHPVAPNNTISIFPFQFNTIRATVRKTCVTVTLVTLILPKAIYISFCIFPRQYLPSAIFNHQMFLGIFFVVCLCICFPSQSSQSRKLGLTPLPPAPRALWHPHGMIPPTGITHGRLPRPCCGPRMGGLTSLGSVGVMGKRPTRERRFLWVDGG